MKEDPRNKREKNSKDIKDLFKEEIFFLNRLKKEINGIDFTQKVVGSVPRKTENKDSDYDVQLFLKDDDTGNLLKEKLMERGYTHKKEKKDTCRVFEAFTKKKYNPHIGLDTNIDLSIHYCRPKIDEKWNINPTIPEDIKDIIYCTNQAIKKHNPKQKIASHQDITINAGEFQAFHIKQKLK